MKIIPQYKIEVGDKVLFLDGMTGYVKSLNKHCDHCPQWCDVFCQRDKDGNGMRCPNLETLKWNKDSEIWECDCEESTSEEYKKNH